MKYIVSCPEWSGTYTTREQAEAAILRFFCTHEHTIEEVEE